MTHKWHIRQERVVVEAHETDTIKAFQEWGFKTVPVPFRSFMPFGKYYMKRAIQFIR